MTAVHHEAPDAYSLGQTEPQTGFEIPGAQPGVFFYPGQEAPEQDPLTAHEAWLVERTIGILGIGPV